MAASSSTCSPPASLLSSCTGSGRASSRAPPLDEIAREYLLIGLSLGEHDAGIVDSYFGPPDIRQQARDEKASPVELIARAAALRARLGEVDDAQRAQWLDRQLIALETIGRELDGQNIP